MEKLRKSIYLLLCVVTVVVMIASILSMFRNTESRYLKMLDFPRIQFFLASLVTMVLFIVMTRKWRWYDYALVVGLVAGLAINGTYLKNYTSFAAERVHTAPDAIAEADKLSIILANVKMKNREAQPILEYVASKDPDFFVAMEVDEWWDEQLRGIEKDYPYTEESINEVAYGMTLYSKYPLQNVLVNNLQHEKVPSFEATVTLPNGRDIVLHTVHPVPPKHFENLPDNKGEEEVALLKIGEKVTDNPLPAIVAGDLNDVVWGYTDELTGTKGKLFDVRVGRGFFNSFDATKWYMRWPIDHVFVTEEFNLKALERGPDIGSDHFPIWVELVLTAD